MSPSTITPVTHGRSAARDASWNQRYEYVLSRHRGMSPTEYSPEHTDHREEMRRRQRKHSGSGARPTEMVEGVQLSPRAADMARRILALLRDSPASSYELAQRLGSGAKSISVGAIVKRLCDGDVVDRLPHRQRRGAPTGNTHAPAWIWRVAE